MILIKNYQSLFAALLFLSPVFSNNSCIEYFCLIYESMFSSKFVLQEY